MQSINNTRRHLGPRGARGWSIGLRVSAYMAPAKTSSVWARTDSRQRSQPRHIPAYGSRRGPSTWSLITDGKDVNDEKNHTVD